MYFLINDQFRLIYIYMYIYIYIYIYIHNLYAECVNSIEHVHHLYVIFRVLGQNGVSERAILSSKDLTNVTGPSLSNVSESLALQL